MNLPIPAFQGLSVLLGAAALLLAGCSAAGPSSPAGAAADGPVADAAPAFTLPDLDGASRSLADYRGKWVVLEWTNPGCPFVRKHYDTDNMQALQRRYTGKGVVWLSICSSSPGKQGYAAPADWKSRARTENWGASAVLLDPDGTVGRLYGAKTTPHMFVIDPRGGIVYRGAIDDKKSADKSDVATARNYVAETLDAALAGRTPPTAETAPYGCSVKY